jgi:hypothetical protein
MRLAQEMRRSIFGYLQLIVRRAQRVKPNIVEATCEGSREIPKNSAGAYRESALIGHTMQCRRTVSR